MRNEWGNGRTWIRANDRAAPVLSSISPNWPPNTLLSARAQVQSSADVSPQRGQTSKCFVTIVIIYRCNYDRPQRKSVASRLVVFTGRLRAELERSLIVERVKAGLRNARAKGKTLGRPHAVVDHRRICALRAQGVGWKRIASELKVGVGTIYRIAGTIPQAEFCSSAPTV
jgi:hypothetical protein